jgi:hypothetical protein
MTFEARMLASSHAEARVSERSDSIEEVVGGLEGRKVDVGNNKEGEMRTIWTLGAR